MNAAEAEIAVLATREALAPLRELHKRVHIPAGDDSGLPADVCATCRNVAGYREAWPTDTDRLIYPEEEL